MKKIYYIFAALSAFTVVSCAQKEELEEPCQDQDFNVEIAGEEYTKTTLGSKSGTTYPLTWTAGDAICVNGQMSEALASGGSKSASFKVSGLGTATSYNVTYPGKEGYDNIASFPSTASRTAPVLPMYAAASSRTFTMKHLAGVLKLSLASSTSVKISAIDLSTPGGEPLSGDLVIGKTSGGALDGSLTGGDGSVTVNCGSGITLSTTAVDVLVPVPALTYSQGIQVVLTTTAAKTMTFTVLNGGGTVAGGKVLEFDTVYYQEDETQEEVYVIKNAATLKSFASFINSGETHDKMKNALVTASFSVGASDAAAIEEINGYMGVFNGNNKTITGLTKPLFNTVYGVVKNLTLNSTIAISESDTYATGMFARLLDTSNQVDEPGGIYGCTAKGSLSWAAPSTESQDHTIGGIVGRVKGGIVSGCTNEATITTSNSTSNQLMLGGIMGRGETDALYSQGSDVTDCTNKGTVSLGGSTSMAYVGGVTGFDIAGACNTSGCSNSGTVQIGESGYGVPLNVGGVVGMSSGTMDENSNSGTVQMLFAGSLSPYIYVGGVVGRIGSTSKTFTSLKHLSDGKVIVNGQAYAAIIGGVVGWMKGGTASEWQCDGDVTLAAGGAYTVMIGGIAGLAGNRKAAKKESDDGSKHMTFTGCTVTSTAEIATSESSYITGSTTANDNCMAVGGMFGRITEGVTVEGGSSAASVNVVPVTMASDKYQPYCIGGIAGYASILSNAATTTGIAFNGVVNTGAVTLASGSNTVYSASNIGGIIGWTRLFKADAPVVLTDCVNKGTVSCNAAEPVGTYVGGIAGQMQTTADCSAISLVRCINGDSANSTLGAVSNSGSNGSNDMILGGVCAKITGVTDLPITLQGCRNYGPVTNSGANTWQASEVAAASWGVLTAGIVGRAQDACSLSATSATDDNRNINYGTITDNSVSKSPCLGGVVGAAAGAAPDFRYCENRGTLQFTGASTHTVIAGGVCGHTNSNPDLSYTSNYGDVKLLGSSDSYTTGKYVIYGGILGCANSSSGAYTIDYSTNNGAVTVTNFALNASGQFFVGGVMGQIGHDNAQAFDHLTNNGDVILSSVTNPVPSTAYQYIAGILACNGDAKTLTNCTNNGDVEAGNNNADANRLDLKARVGGIASYLTICPDNCVNTGDITCVKKYNKSNNTACQVGGIVGWLNVATIANLTSTGAVRTAGASPVAYIGGIIGQAGTNVTSVQNCTVGGYINGGGTTHGGFFFGGGNKTSIGFTNCYLKKGAKISHKYGGTSTTKQYNTVGVELGSSDYFVLENSYTTSGCSVIE